MNTFKDRLKFYMTKGGFNPTSLSRKSGLSMTAVRDILEHGGTPNPRIDTFIKLCCTLGVLPHQLSPEFKNLYSARHLQLLDEISDLDKREHRLRKAIAQEKGISNSNDKQAD